MGHSSISLFNSHSIGNEIFEGQHLLFRGVHFCSDNFDKKEKKESENPEYHHQTIYSLATQEIAGLKEHDKTIGYEKADQLVKGYFTLLKLTGDKPEFQTDTRRAPPRKKKGEPASYKNLFEHLMQAYVTSYANLYEKGGMARNFNFYANINPVVSTSTDVVAAAHFAGGRFINKDVRYLPEVEKSGYLKDRRLGYVQAYFVDSSYLKKHATDISQLIKNDTIGVDHHHKFASEIAIQSSIPEKYVIGFKVITLPKMKEKWTRSIQKNYGLDENDYNKFKKNLIRSSSELKNEALKKLINKVTEYQALIFEKEVNKVLEVIRNNKPCSFSFKHQHYFDALVKLAKIVKNEKIGHMITFLTHLVWDADEDFELYEHSEWAIEALSEVVKYASSEQIATVLSVFSRNENLFDKFPNDAGAVFTLFEAIADSEHLTDEQFDEMADILETIAQSFYWTAYSSLALKPASVLEILSEKDRKGRF